jgi:hypothetical protein
MFCKPKKVLFFKYSKKFLNSDHLTSHVIFTSEKNRMNDTNERFLFESQTILKKNKCSEKIN